MSTIEDRIKKVVAEQLCLEVGEIKPEDTFIDDLGADSLDKVELVMAIEDEFELEIPYEKFEKIQTIQQAVDYITGRAA